MTEAIQVSGYLRTLKLSIGGLCLWMAVLGGVTMLNPLGPSGEIARAAQFIVSLTAIPVGLWWMVGRWPSFARAVGFVVWADVSMAVAAVVAATPEARIVTVIDMTLVGVFVSFLLGPWVLAVHCTAAATLLIGLNAQAVMTGERAWFDLYLFMTPAMAAVVVMPIVIQAVIEGGRRAVARTARQAMRDPMTGLRNRRGMRDAVQRLVTGRRDTVLIAAAFDLDRFKQLNDDHGHQRGDDALRAVADALRSSIRSGDIAARLGGDEFVVIAAMGSDEGTDSFVERIRAAMDTVTDIVTASVGVAWASGRVPDEDLIDEVLRLADRACYDAKRQGGNKLLVAPPTH